MKTKFRNLGMAIVFSIAAIGVNATEIKNATRIVFEPLMEIEAWMTNAEIFEAKESETESSTVVEQTVTAIFIEHPQATGGQSIYSLFKFGLFQSCLLQITYMWKRVKTNCD